ncbi:glycosyltransferase family 4 protein [Pseudobacteroides cellulosolvens]|uniref:Glycosyl transferase group 1 n=1 Tax=Pseudobacteroides cellulosolvens ATCC 35603 = DSM 2933 TaxID=398512 RepID=A0A0L6JR11_9FIRM|nr:glycosyltransferase family 4 protein [Pseudobacteroides cellulosolvens]KNY28219.1 glycosyl transferase group 1 [Pseudobacteroides cellulosolvens ATCC 35603 = DSM 2933]
MYLINMLSSADKIKGQGVGSAYLEQVELVRKGLGDRYAVVTNKLKLADIMHYHTFDLQFYFLSSLAKFKGVNVGYVHLLPETVDGSLEFPTLIKKIFYKYIISFYKKMDYLVTVNPYFIKLLKNYGVNESKITYIPNFVSIKNFYPIKPDKKLEIRRKYGIGENEFVVLGVGQVQTRKGVMDFIETAKNLSNIRFIWAGGFSFGRITAGYKELKKIVDDPPSNVEFPGILDREHMNELYNIANVLFLPSYSELFPMTILEAFNCKLPILLRDLDIYPDVFFDYYQKGSNVKEFTDIIRAMSDDVLIRSYWENQSWKGHQFYSEENVLSMWKSFYDSVNRKEQKESPKAAL